MSKKKRDHAWGENGFEHWVNICTKLIYITFLFVFFHSIVFIRLFSLIILCLSSFMFFCNYFVTSRLLNLTILFIYLSMEINLPYSIALSF